MKRLLLTIPDDICDWLQREARKRDVTVQNRIRAVLENNVGKAGRPIFGAKEQKEVDERVRDIAKKFYSLYATERRRLRIIDVSRSRSLAEEFVKPIPVISKSFANFVFGHDEIDEGPIREAVKFVSELENKVLSVCDDGEEVFESSPFNCWTWHSADGNFYGMLRLALNSRKTPTVEDMNRVVSEFEVKGDSDE